MDWNLAIERNREALKRILAALVAMAGGAAFTSPLWEGRREASGGGCALAITPTRQSDDRRPPHKGEVNFSATLPRYLHTAVLRLLRPAESAVRRLVIVAARNIVVPPPPPRSAWSPSPASQERINGIAGTTWILSRSKGRRTADLSTEAQRAKVEGGGGGIAEPRSTRPSRCRFSIGSHVGKPVPAARSPPACRASRCPALPRGFPSCPGACQRPAIRSTPRASACGSQHSPQPSTTCRARQNASPAGRRAAMRSARRKETQTPPRKPAISLMSAAARIETGRCVPAVRPAGDAGLSTRSTKS
jgi:hypothetical protein